MPTRAHPWLRHWLRLHPLLDCQWTALSSTVIRSLLFNDVILRHEYRLFIFDEIDVHVVSNASLGACVGFFGGLVVGRNVAGSFVRITSVRIVAL